MYNFDLAISATVSKTVAEEMIQKIVEQQTGKKVSSIEVRLRQITKGIGPSESTETVFDGFHIFFNEEKSRPKESSDKQGFVKATYQ
jgi:hypothetical protein